jgi:prevent-host-death family protein
VTEVGTAELRGSLRDWMDRVQAGDDIIVTERGRPVARITRIDAAPLIDRLTAAGVVSRPAASTRARLTKETLIRTKGSVSELIVGERDRHR